MGDVRLTSPRVQVLRDGYDPLEVQTTNRDLLLWDTTRAKHKWPKFEDAPFLWLTFLSWSAARRTGAIAPEVRFEDWSDDVLQVTALDEDDEDDEFGTPTEPGRAPG